MKKIIVSVLVSAMFFSICMTSGASEAKTKAPVISKKKIELEKGKTTKLKIKYNKKKVKWSTEDNEVAKVSKKGKVTAVSAGSTNIVAKVAKKKFTCKVIVTQPIVYNNDIFTEDFYKKISYITEGEIYGDKKISTADGISEIYAVLAGVPNTFKDVTDQEFEFKIGGTYLEFHLKDGTTVGLNLNGPILFQGKKYETDTVLTTPIANLLQKYLYTAEPGKNKRTYKISQVYNNNSIFSLERYQKIKSITYEPLGSSKGYTVTSDKGIFKIYSLLAERTLYDGGEMTTGTSRGVITLKYYKGGKYSFVLGDALMTSKYVYKLDTQIIDQVVSLAQKYSRK